MFRRVLIALVAAAALALPASAAANPWPRGDGVPDRMERIYRDSGARFGVDPKLLAAIGLSESRHGRARLPGVFSGVNFAGCCAGPAQLCVVRSCGRVWQHYRVDGDGDGRRSVYDRDDAFATAARYVVALRRFTRSRRARSCCSPPTTPGRATSAATAACRRSARRRATSAAACASCGC